MISSSHETLAGYATDKGDEKILKRVNVYEIIWRTGGLNED